MNTISLLRNAFLALSLSDFLISSTYAAQPADDALSFASRGPLRSDAAADIPEIEISEERAGAIERAQQADGNITAVLPPEVLEHILGYVAAEDVPNVDLTCVDFHKALFRSKNTEQFRTVTPFLRNLQETGQASPLVDTMLSSWPIAHLKIVSGIFKEDLRRLRVNDYPGNLLEGIFEGATAVHLWLNNYTGNLTAETFADSLVLNHLYIEDYTGDLLEGVFSGLERVNELHIRGYTGSNLPEGIFAGLRNGWLSIEDYTGVLPESIFAGLGGHLKSLNLKGFTGILPEGIFDGLWRVTDLYLNDYTGDLTAETFASLQSLQFLSLTGYTGNFPPEERAALESHGVNIAL